MSILNFFIGNRNSSTKIIDDSLELIKNCRKEFEVEVYYQKYHYQIEMLDSINASLVRLSNGEDVYLHANSLMKQLAMISRSLDGRGTDNSDNYLNLLACNLKEIEEKYQNHIHIEKPL